jgi:hypothetical protein
VAAPEGVKLCLNTINKLSLETRVDEAAKCQKRSQTAYLALENHLFCVRRVLQGVALAFARSGESSARKIGKLVKRSTCDTAGLAVHHAVAATPDPGEAAHQERQVLLFVPGAKLHQEVFGNLEGHKIEILARTILLPKEY